MRLLIMGPAGRRQGHPGRSAERALRNPGDLHRRYLPLQHQEQDRARRRSAQVHRQGRACAGRADQQDRQGPSGHGRRQERLDSRWLSAQRLPGSRLSTPSWASWTPRLTPVVALDADHDVLMERMKKRAEIEGRSDDTPEAIAKRLDVYAKETAPLLDIYQKRGLLKTFRRRRRRRDPGHHRGGAWLNEKPSRITYFQRKRESRHAERVLIPAFRVFLQVGVSSGTHSNRQGTERGSWLKTV